MRFEVIDSTNRYLAEAARAGAAEGLVVVAAEQTAGRGRLDRRWEAPAGSSLLCSFLFRPAVPVDRRFCVTALVGMAAVDACAAVAGVVASLKWPNDLLAGDLKLAGVLAEVVPPPAAGPETRDALVVGLGLNVNWPAGWPPESGPPELSGLARTAVALNRLVGAEVDMDKLLARLLDGVRGHYLGLGEEGGWRRVMSGYRSRCATIGSLVEVTTSEEEFTGRALDVTDDGSLLVDVGACIRTVDAGDVVHVRPGGRH